MDKTAAGITGVRKNAPPFRYLLLFDEVQSGVGRTDKMWCIEHTEVEPDMITWGKGMGGCFTSQNCFGHFVYSGKKDPHNLESRPINDIIGRVAYRTA